MTSQLKQYLVPLAGLAVGIGIGLGGGFLLFGTTGESGIEDYGIDMSEVTDSHIVEGTETECLEGMWVDISGAVEIPGVYCLTLDAIVRDGIEIAGGISQDVCTVWVERELNQAARIEPNSKVYVRLSDDAGCEGTAAASPSGGATTPSSSSSGLCSDGRVSINRATVSELESISGVGPSTAAKIVAARPFARLEDLTDVSGIGDATFEKMKNEICL